MKGVSGVRWSVRRAALADVPELNRLRLTVRENMLTDPSAVTEAMTAEAISVTGRGWVAADSRDILGFSIANSRNRSIWALFVAPLHEGKGIGSALLDEAVQWLWSEGQDPIWLGTDPGTRAEVFYRARGWRESGTRSNGEILFKLFFSG